MKKQKCEIKQACIRFDDVMSFLSDNGIKSKKSLTISQSTQMNMLEKKEKVMMILKPLIKSLVKHYQITEEQLYRNQHC